MAFRACLWATAGLSVFVILLNRWLVLGRYGPVKRPAIAGAFLLLVPGSALVGASVGAGRLSLGPAAVLLAVLVGEMRQICLRWRYRGQGPIRSERAPTLLSQPVTTTDLACAHFDVEISAWNGPALRVAHFSDLHVSDASSDAHFRRVVRHVNSWEPDLIFATGDFVSDARFAPLLPELLSGLSGRFGVLAVLGNHDYWTDALAVKRAVREAGMTVLDNECALIRLEGGAGVLVCGDDDPWAPTRWRAPKVPPGVLALALTHTPDNIYRLARAGFVAAFAGHNHAGQIRLPWLGSIVVPSIYGRRFDHGHFQVRGCHLFVTAGVGAAEPAFRLYCQPDFYVVDLRPARAAGGGAC